MQFQLTRYEYVKTIEFKSGQLQNLEAIRYFKEEGVTGTFTKKEFRYSWDNTTWTNWNTLTQGALSSIVFRDQPSFYLEVKYSRSGIGAGNIQRWYLFADSTSPTPPTPPVDASVDATTLGGQPPEYFLNRENFFGPYTDLEVSNVVDGSAIGVYHSRTDSSLGTEFFFKRLEGDGIIQITEPTSGKIVISADALRDSSITELYSLIDVIDSSISYLVNWNTSIDASIADLYSREASIGVVNVGDGSVGIFAGFDASGNIKLKTLSGSGAAVITEVGEQIIIGLDASFSGEVNYGVNVGGGDASVYAQKVGDALQFRELKAGPSITLDVSGNLILIDASVSSGPGGDGIDGGVWITNITPTSGGNVGDKVYSSDGVVLDSCLTDTSALTVHVLALPGHTNYKPVITINGNPVTISATADKPVFTGTYPMTYNFSDASITVLHEDGAHWSTIVDADTPAVIQLATFINGYPGSQTELKAGDTYDVSIMTDVSIVSVIVDNYEAATGGTYAVSGNNVGITITIADRGNITTARGLRLRVVKSTGSTSANYLTTLQGSVDGRDVVFLNNTYPSISFGSVTYPVGQQAIKTAESATVNHTVTNYTTINYTSPGSQLTISNPTLYEAAKNVNYSAGTYNISTNNFSISANRAQNDATSINSTVVWIAAVAPTLSVSNPAARLRSGGNDGTSIQTHVITITSSQRLLAAPLLTKDTGGTWLGSAFSWSAGATSFTRSMQVSDSMSKGVYNWTGLSGTGLAGLVQTTNSGSTTYTLGGFVQRTISVPAFGWQSNINVEVADYSKLSSTGTGQALAWSVKSLSTRSTIGDTTRPQADVWSASATFTNPTTINILDKSATDSASQASTFTIQEGI